MIGCGGKQTSAPATATSEAKPTANVPTDDAESTVITSGPFGTVDGKEVSLYVLTNANGLILKVTNYGAIVTEFHVPDRDGKLADIVGGYDTAEGYVEKTPYFGATIGRLANRVSDNGRFTLDGKQYQLAANDPPYHLHGGNKGWDKVIWEVVDAQETEEGPSIKLKYFSPDGEEGYPGNVTAFVTYTLTNENEFKVHMEATTDQTTIINMAHHSYWNLGGYDSGTITDHVLTIYGDEYTPGNPVVADGTITPVKGTPFDFTSPKPIGKDMMSVQIEGNPAGYDHNWVINGDPHTLRPVARVEEPKSGRVMTLEGDQPGLMFYAGLFLDGTITGKGHTYQQYEAFCLETQKFPNSINVPAWRDEVILKPGQTYEHHMIHRFSAE
ncbi:MAG: galactose mutarotase [Deltaproteobacteria bacterium]|nr:galactose mutarotase [Deltaproteobacteria bacterium]MBN2670259.1 galactose mutarotase [Deltaproteobacteria bacterium]